MPKKLITLLGLVALSACSGSAPAAEVAEETRMDLSEYGGVIGADTFF